MDPPETGASGTTTGRYRFDDVVVDATAHTLFRGDVEQPVEPKAFAVLLALLQRPGELVEHADLLDRVWGHRHVTPGVLTRAIAQLRQALGDDSHDPRYIQTRHSLGYCFIGALQPGAEVEVAPASRAAVDATSDQGEVAPDAAARTDDAGSTTPTQAARAQAEVAGAASRMHGHDVHFRWKSPWLVAFALAATAVAAWMLVDRMPSPPAPAEASIAVMPFTSLSSDRKDDYFAEGLAEEMRDALAGVKGLKVAASVSPAARVGAADAKALGAKLGVATILDASVRREGDRLRISARLSDTSTGFTIWSHTYDREQAGVFATQSEIAGEVVRSLLGSIPGEEKALAKRLTPTLNVSAFNDYLMGLQQLVQSADTASNGKAVRFFRQALAADTGFARAQAGICRSQVSTFEYRRNADDFGLAQAACRRAQELDPGLSEVDLALGDLYQAHGDFGKAIEYYTRAETDPARLPAVYLGIGLVHAEQGHGQQALGYFKRALALRPGDADINAHIGYRYYLAGDVQTAIKYFRKAVELRPTDADRWSSLGGLYLTAGDNSAAAKALERSLAIAPNYAALGNLGEIKYQQGAYAEAAALYRKALALDPSDFMMWGNLGEVLLADPADAALARHAFDEARKRAQRYTEIKSSDAKAIAALGWYRSNLGEVAQAREAIRRSEALEGEPGEVALFNAMTLVRLGDMQQALARVAAARAAGVAENRITSNVVLHRANPGSTAAGPGRASLSAPNDKGPTPGG